MGQILLSMLLKSAPPLWIPICSYLSRQVEPIDTNSPKFIAEVSEVSLPCEPPFKEAPPGLHHDAKHPLEMHISPFSIYRLILDYPPLNYIWKGKVMLVYWERPIVPWWCTIISCTEMLVPHNVSLVHLNTHIQNFCAFQQGVQVWKAWWCNFLDHLGDHLRSDVWNDLLCPEWHFGDDLRSDVPLRSDVRSDLRNCTTKLPYTSAVELYIYSYSAHPVNGKCTNHCLTCPKGVH